MSNRTAMLAAILALGGLLILGGRASAQTAPSTAPALPQPTLITLDMQQATHQAVFDELGRQAGVEFATNRSDLWQRLGGGPIDVHINKAQFFEVLRMLSLQNGVAFASTDDRRITLTQAEDNVVTVMQNGQRITRRARMGVSLVSPLATSSLQGLFRFVPTRITRSSSADPLRPDNVNRSMQLEVQCFADPKARLVGASSQFRLNQAIDDKGNSLLPQGQGYSQPYLNNSSWMWQAQCPLNGSLEVGSRIARLSGSVRVRLATKVERLEFDDVLAGGNVEKKAGEVRCTLGAVSQQGSYYRVPVTIWRDGRSDQTLEQLRQLFASRSGAQLLDENGRSFPNYGMVSSNADSEKAQMTLQFYAGRTNNVQPRQAKKLVWDVPVEVRDVDVPVELAGLPLP